ncbi:hypothetical protein QVD17_17564 [Tagetes erecta]|uniref:Uncharacterized protein n=1 Tax=Tagetes erecta TaxID=13708 RepID=A0AAD8KZQ9_TARER|nr:hypothetical protein QVD17_17564 [Tagetes erecta]
MATFSGLEIGLSFVCGCVLLACAGEVCYLLWWKKRRDDIENKKTSSFCYSNYTPTHLSCWKTLNFSKPTKTQESYQDSNMGMVQDQVLNDLEEESLDLELMRLHNLHGPPRFLTTINEETKEELESQRSRKGSRTRSLSDLLVHFDTPQASPPLKGSQLLDLQTFQFNHHGVNMNPLFEVDNKSLRSSPPPTFKFLRDAEEKLLRRLKELEIEKGVNSSANAKMEENIDGSFVNMGGNKGKNNGIQQNHQVSAPSKVLPLASSPSK